MERGSPASLCQKLERKWARCHAFGRPANPFGPDEDGQDTLEGRSRRSTRSEEFSKRKESLTLVNRGRGCFSPANNEIFPTRSLRRVRRNRDITNVNKLFNISFFSCKIYILNLIVSSLNFGKKLN